MFIEIENIVIVTHESRHTGEPVEDQRQHPVACGKRPPGQKGNGAYHAPASS
jgi:hypothetical protein